MGPDWRMPAFYDRQVQVVRHIGLLEGLITLLVLASFIQYGMGWANYLEQKFLAPKPKEKRSTRRRARRWWTSLSISSPPSMTLFPSSSMSSASGPLNFQNMQRVSGKRGG